jgi:hypothetical protein
MEAAMTAPTVRAPTSPTPHVASAPTPSAQLRAHAARPTPLTEARSRFGAILQRAASTTLRDTLEPRGGVKPMFAQRVPNGRHDDAHAAATPERRPAKRHDRGEPDPCEPLAAFRLPPQVLQAPSGAVAPPPAPRNEVARLAEQLVTRLRVGRSREGASVELRLALSGRELDVRLVETAHGLELHADGDDTLCEAIARELVARGLPLAT